MMNVNGRHVSVVVLGVALAIVSIMLVFSGNGNKVLRQENISLDKSIKDLQVGIDARNKEIAEHTEVIEALQKDVTKWDSLLTEKRFIHEENIISISNDFGDNIDFLAKYLSEITPPDKTEWSSDSSYYLEQAAKQERYFDSIQTCILEGTYKRRNCTQ